MAEGLLGRKLISQKLYCCSFVLQRFITDLNPKEEIILGKRLFEKMVNWRFENLPFIRNADSSSLFVESISGS